MLRPEQIELRVRQRLDRAKAGDHVEDSSIELKDQWPDPIKTARRLAAHANAARLEPIIWVIGAKDDGTVSGAAKEDLASIWPAVEAEFEDRFAPELLRSDLIAYDSASVLAVTWVTNRPPYVVKRSDYFEVPWRDGTRVRSAKRHELLRMLTSTVTLPSCEPFGLEIALLHNGAWRIDVNAEVVPLRKDTVLLRRGATLRVFVDGTELGKRKGTVVAIADGASDNDVRHTSGGVDIVGPALLDFFGEFDPSGSLREITRVRIAATFRVARSDTPLAIAAQFGYRVTGEPIEDPPRGRSFEPLDKHVEASPANSNE